MTKSIVFISTSSFAEYDDWPLKLLKDAGTEIRLNPHKRQLTKDECLDLYQDIDGLLAGTEPLTAEVMKSAKNLKVISRCGTGMDNVDREAAKQLGIKVFNTPDAPTMAVAELTLGLMLSLLRQLPRMDREIHAGKWQKRMGNLLQGKTVGIIGFGRIGQKVGELVKALGAAVFYSDPVVDKTNYKKTSLEQLLAQADIVTLHLSGSKGGPLLGAKEMASMKKGALLINCARGEVVDEAALVDSLQSEHLAGAALDVFKQEPYTGPLTKFDNVILTPHIGSYAVESRVQMEIEAAENLIKGLKG